MDTIETRAQKYLDATPGWSADDIHKVMAGFAKSERQQLEAALKILREAMVNLSINASDELTATVAREALAKAKALLE